MNARPQHHWLVHSLAAIIITASTTLWPNNGARANTVTYFEIPVADMDRAIQFYSTVFGYSFERTRIDGYEMALFPSTDNAIGAAGALAKGDVYVPSKNGVIVYFSVQDIDAVLALANTHGGATLYEKSPLVNWVFLPISKTAKATVSPCTHNKTNQSAQQAFTGNTLSQQLKQHSLNKVGNQKNLIGVNMVIRQGEKQYSRAFHQ